MPETLIASPASQTAIMARPAVVPRPVTHIPHGLVVVCG
jgi:hypothetical protein